jgi:hypothetical protein
MACQVRFAYAEVEVVALIGGSHSMSQGDFDVRGADRDWVPRCRTVSFMKLLLLDRWSGSVTLLTTLSDQQLHIPSWPGA